MRMLGINPIDPIRPLWVNNPFGKQVGRRFVVDGVVKLSVLPVITLSLSPKIGR